jgi:hypothetical protein
MHTADLIFYPANDQPTRLMQIDCDQCLRFLMPYIQSCRESGRVAAAVAEIDFRDGGVVWFASEEGVIDVHRERPRFGRSRRWLGIFPAPAFGFGGASGWFVHWFCLPRSVSGAGR